MLNDVTLIAQQDMQRSACSTQSQDIVQIRLKDDVHGSLLFAKSLKLLGNGHYRDRLHLQAVHEYERSLSVLEWLEPLEGNWRHEVRS